MIKKAICLLAFTAILATSCKEKEAVPAGLNTEGWGVMKFSETEHDFGEINAIDKVTHTFTFTNEGQTDLLITQAVGSCGCTVPDYPKEPLAPGDKGEIKVAFDPSNKNGLQSKTVTITANTQKGTEVLTIKANVLRKPGDASGKQTTKTN